MPSCSQFRALFMSDYSSAYEWSMYWEGQYALYNSGYRGVKLHDVTLEIMGRA